MASTTEPGHSVPAFVANAVRAVFRKKRQKEDPPLELRDLRTALTLNSSKLVEELWTITQKQVEFEVTRHSRLETKATSLLTATGLSLTVAFTFGSTLLKEGAKFGAWYYLTVLFFALACIAGLVAALMAVFAVVLREQKWVNEHSLFNPRVLGPADVPDETNAETLTNLEAAGLVEFRKAMIPHLWEIRQKYHESYKDKAEFVLVGQWSFLAFLGCLLLLCICNVIALSQNHDEAKDKQAEQIASAKLAQAPVPQPVVVATPTPTPGASVAPVSPMPVASAAPVASDPPSASARPFVSAPLTPPRKIK